jgi:hypothetical protein
MGEAGELSRDAARALAALERHGLLLVTDAKLPSLVGLIAGGPVRGSWWSHPRGQAIFAAATQLEDHPDVAVVKLVSGKLTFVHRRLWPALLAAATSGALWQTKGLSPAARRLLRRVGSDGVLRADESPAVRAAARVLAERLLVHAESVHTQSGAHATELEGWGRWARRRRVKAARGAAAGAIDDALQALMARSGGKGTLPWH